LRKVFNAYRIQDPDPHSFSNLDPDPDSTKKLIRIRIRIKSMRIRNTGRQYINNLMLTAKSAKKHGNQMNYRTAMKKKKLDVSVKISGPAG
jgi:hypothetical protein